MADKCIVFVNKQQQFNNIEQNQNTCELNQTNDSSITETAILSTENAQIELDASILSSTNVTPVLNTKVQTIPTGDGLATIETSVTTATRNDEDDEEDVSERNHDLLFSASIGGEKIAYLETPVLDDNNELLDIDASATDSHHHHLLHQHHHCKRHCCLRNADNEHEATKPKRLSDEFFADDDDEMHSVNGSAHSLNRFLSCSQSEENEDDDNSGLVIVRQASIASNYTSDAGSDVVDAASIVKPCATIVSGAAVDDEISTCSLNLLSDNNLAPQILEDSSSPHSSLSHDLVSDINSAILGNVADVVEELTNQGDEHPQPNRLVTENDLFSNNSNSNHDVQSMDAIERRDFELEQKATVNRILGTNALAHRNRHDDVRLNLGLINKTTLQPMDQSDELESTNTQTKDEQCCNEANVSKSSTTSCSTSTTAFPPIGKLFAQMGDGGNSQAGGSSSSSSGSCSNSNSNQLVTTPTTSRTKRSRFNLNSNKLSKSLEKCPELSEQSGDDRKLEYFANNSNDSSLSSDNQYAMEQMPTESIDVDPNDMADSAKDAPSGSQCTVCSACKNTDNANECNEIDDILEDDDDDDDDEEDEAHFANDHPKPSTSKGESSRNNCCDCLYSPRTHQWKFGSCMCAQKSKKDVGTETDASCSAPSSSLHFRRAQSKASTSGHGSNNMADELNISNNFKLMMGLETENSYDDWSCEANSDTEEVCTCRDYSDDEIQASSEDELPSRDVDLSYYSISEDVLNGNSTETPTSRNHRKRKLTETRTPLFCDLGSGSNIDALSSDRKRLALDNVSKCGVSPTPTTPTSTIALNSPSSTVSLRTPRSVIPTRDNPPPELSNWLIQFQQWSHVERLLAVDRLIEHCEPTQVRHMMKVIEPQFQRDFISLLPKELALQVLSYLPPKDLLRAAQTCRSWRYLCDDNLLWKEKCKQSGICIENSADRPRRGRVGNMPPIASPWKAAYMRQHIIEMNWRSRPIRDPKILKGHDDHVITCLQFYGNRIVSGSDDNTLKVWSAITGKCLRTLVGHTGGVWSSQMSANIIISGSTDRTLKVWNAENGNCIHTLMGHTSTVRCMHLHEKT